MAKEWYVIHTFSGHENKVKLALEKKIENETDPERQSRLQSKIKQVKIPTVEVPEVKDGKKRVKSKKFFPGYVLIEMDMDDETWSFVKNIPGVTNFVGAFGSSFETSKPKPLSRDEVNSLFDQMGEQKTKEKVTSAVMDFSVGEHIKVIDGPFSNFSGVVEEVYPDKGRLRVKVEIFGRGTPVELDFLQVGKI
ncbi:MAG TPA: transcription termination/antitermination protein NusG [Spirochaetota bacterium]|nr:transcription termination/antitermination protein NusG [Spirochaetota bacterium]HPI90264.1 transcription termination/antitermination protein NusG [Spirochaetota bacterium]HPR46495.1 transcription termination/antitermination protein NusG [Spirochaetota bacterium]